MPGRLGEEGEGMEVGFTSGFLTLGVVFPKKVYNLYESICNKLCQSQ